MTTRLEPTSDGSRTEIAQTASAILLCVAGTTMYLILPLFVGVAAEHVGLSDRQIGLLASSEIAGIGLASLLAVTWQHRVSWRLAAAGSLAFIVVGDLLSIGATSAGSLLALRFFTGLLGEGPAYALGLACLGEGRKPDRAFLELTASQVAYAATALWGLPYVVSSWGFPGMLIVFAAIAVLVLPFVRWLPRESRKVRSTTRVATSRTQGSRLALVALVFHMVFFTGVGSIWAYVERMGRSSGLATELDTHGRFLVLAPAFQAAGNTLGPAVAASLLSGQGYQPVNWLGGLCCVTSFAVFFVLVGRAGADPTSMGGRR